MEELTKKDILTILGENLTDIRHAGYRSGYTNTVTEEPEGDVDEMAIEKYKIDPKTGAKVINKKFPTSKTGIPTEKPLRKSREGSQYEPFRPMFYPPHETEDKTEAEEHVGWYYTPQGEGSTTTPIVFSCEWDQLLERSPQLIEMLKEKYGKVKFVNDNCPTAPPRSRSGASLSVDPIPGDEGDSEELEKTAKDYFFKSDEDIKKVPTRSKIRKTLYDTLRDNFGDQELQDQMKKLSIPPLYVDNESNSSGESDKRITPHVDRFSTTNNELIEFATHSIQLYKTQNEFLQHSTKSLRSDPKDIEDVKTTAIRRKYSRRNYAPTVNKLAQVGNYGKTDVLKLDKYDVPEEDFEVLVSTDFALKGEATNKDGDGKVSEWTWTINYDLKYGKRSPEDRQIRNTNTDAEINNKVTVTLPEPISFDGKYEIDPKTWVNISKGSEPDTGDNHPLTNQTILKGLETVLGEFKGEIMSTNPSSSVRRAISSIDKLGANALRPQQSQMNENEIRDFVKRTLLKK